MDKNVTAALPQEPREDEVPQIANMDEIDFMTLLLESRIIQAS